MNHQRNHGVVIFLALAVGFSVVGCTRTNSARDTASMMAAYTTTVRVELDTFGNVMDVAAQDRQARINALEMQVAQFESWKNARASAWAMTPANLERSRLYTALIDASERDLKNRLAVRRLADQHRQLIKDARSRVHRRSKELASTAKTLTLLSEERSVKDDVTFFIGFFKSVKSTLDELKKEAEATTEAAKNKLPDVDTANLPPSS